MASPDRSCSNQEIFLQQEGGKVPNRAPEDYP